MTSLLIALAFRTFAHADCSALEAEPVSPFASGAICRKLATEFPDDLIGGSLELQIVHCRNKGVFKLKGGIYTFTVPLIEGVLTGTARLVESADGAKTPDVELDTPSLG